MDQKKLRVVAAVCEHDGRYLITQRRATAVLPLMWEFPGGKVEPDETDQQALHRELHERLGARATIGRKLGEKVHHYEGYSVDLVLYEAVLDPSAALAIHRVNDYRWVRSHEFEQYPFPDADQQTMDQLLGMSQLARA